MACTSLFMCENYFTIGSQVLSFWNMAWQAADAAGILVMCMRKNDLLSFASTNFQSGRSQGQGSARKASSADETLDAQLRHSSKYFPTFCKTV
jgi:hypothetical protein